MTVVLRHFRVWMTVTAWLLAMGSHWDAVQAFAWGRMIYNYSQVMPMADAVRAAFAPGNMCGICRLVNSAKASQESNQAPELKADSKIQLFFQPVPRPIVAGPGSAPWPSRDPLIAKAERTAPPLPPPRLVAA